MTRHIKPAIAGLLAVAPIGVLCAFGGDSSSATSTTNNTTNLDARVVGGNAPSTNASISGNSGPVSISTTDQGTVSGAFHLADNSLQLADNSVHTSLEFGDKSLQLAFAGLEGANKLASQTIAANGNLLNGALSMSGAQNSAFTDTVKDIKTSDVRVLVIAGLAVVAVVGVKLLKG